MDDLKSAVPTLRFPEFNGSWEHKQLNELMSEAKKRNVDLRYSKDDVLSVSGELGIVNQVEHLGRSYAGESVHNYHIVEVGDIVYTKSPLKANPFGIIRLNKSKVGIVSTLYAVYKVKTENALGLFLDYYFSLDANTNRYLRPLVRKGAKNDMKINNSYVLSDRVFIPEINEQQKIAAFLSAVDEKIRHLTRKKGLLEQYKKGVMQKIFGQEIRFKDDAGNDFADWEEKPLGEVSRINPKIDSLPEAFIYIDLESVENGNLNKEEFLLLEDAPSRAQRLLKKGDILFQMVRPYQKNNLFFDREGKYVASTGYAQIRARINPRFLYQCLYNYDFVKDVVRRCTGTSYPAINSDDLSQIRIKVPCPSEQEKIATFLTAIDDQIRLVGRQLKETQNYKKGLLQKMFI